MERLIISIYCPFTFILKNTPYQAVLRQVLSVKKVCQVSLILLFIKGKSTWRIISSIESIKPKYHNLDLGICANKRVLSVLVEKKTANQKGSVSSASSNALAHILKQKGRVIIGDRALKLYLENKNHFIDLCELWYERTHLPFVLSVFLAQNTKQYIKKFFFPLQKVKFKNSKLYIRKLCPNKESKQKRH